MQLIDSPASPFCRKVKVFLHETGMAGDVARWFLWAGQAQEASKEVWARFDRAIAWGRDVAAGRVRLTGVSGEAAAAPMGRVSVRVRPASLDWSTY
jgi:phage gp36-like protein